MHGVALSELALVDQRPAATWVGTGDSYRLSFASARRDRWLDHRDDPDRIRAALRTARGDRLLAALPEGLQTRLCRTSWDGQGLSGGRWQTVAELFRLQARYFV